MQFAKIVGVLALISITACQAAGVTPPTGTLSNVTPALAQGPLAGAVTDTTANIWVRTNTHAQVQIEYSTDATLTSSRRSETKTTDAESDFTTNVSIPNLAAQQMYFYNVRVNDIPQFTAPFPQFQTFAARGSPAPFHFVILTDFRTISKISQNVDTFKHAAQENPAFVIIGGDFDHRNPDSLADKREMFRELYTPAQGMQDFVNLILHRFTLIHFWDDHDFGANNADKTYPAKAESLRVLQEYFPLYPISHYGDWQSFSYGDADFFVLDSRSQRDPHIPRDETTSMLDGDHLGAQGQREWLFNGLKNSNAKWKFIVSPVIFNPTTKVNDGWGAYPGERKMLLSFVRSNKIENVIVLSGDLHAGAIDDGGNSGLPELVAPTANDGFDKRCLTEQTGNLGRWSVGHYGDASGTPCNGYALVNVFPERVELIVKDSQGEIKLSYTVK